MRHSFVCLLLALTSVIAQSDLCYFPPEYGGNAVVDPTTAIACIDSLPFNETVRSLTLQQLRNLVNLYSFTDIATGSGAPFNVKVDLLIELDNIEAKTYTSDYQFHLDLIKLFNQLNDGHTLYYAPSGYFKFINVRPFLLTSFLSDNQTQQIVVLGSSFKYYENYTGIDLSPYVNSGAVVKTINGVNAVQYIKTFSDTIGVYKDGPVRFNAALKETFSYYAYASQEIPAQDFEDYEFEGFEGKVTLPILTVVIRGLSGSEELQALNEFQNSNSDNGKRSLGKPSPHHVKAEGPDALKQHIKDFIKEHSVVDLENHPKFKVSQSNIWNPIAATKAGDTLYGILNGDIAVLKLTTFAPSADPVYFVNPWDDYRQLLEFAVKDAQSRGINKLLIDVVGNGGGYVCLSYATLSFFIKAFRGTAVYQPYDFRESMTTDQLTQIGFISGSERYELGTEESPCGYEWYGPVQYSRGANRTSRYTNKWSIACPADNAPYGESFRMDNGGYYMDKIIVLTDGTCGSACNYFASKLRLEQKAWVVSMGGIAGQEMDIASFAGGNVYDWTPWVDYVQYYLNQSALAMYNMPDFLPTSAATRYNFAEVYFGEDIPREYELMTANQHIDNWLFNYLNVYQEVATIFPGVPGGWPSDSSSTSGDSSSSAERHKSTDVIIGLAVGGAFLLVLVVVGVVLYLRRRNAGPKYEPLGY